MRSFPRRISPLGAILVAMLVALAAVGDANAAPIDAPNAHCRRAVSRAVNKLGSTAMKAFEFCVKTGMKNDAGDCSTLALADLKNKVPSATSKLADKIAGACSDAEHMTALSEHLRCGTPVGAPIASFTDLSTCLNALVTANVEDLFTRLLDADFGAAATNSTDRCIRTIASSANRLFRAVQSGKQRGIINSDEAGGDSSYVDPGDPAGKIALYRERGEAKIVSACSPLPPSDWAAIGSCAGDAAAAAKCVLDDVEAVAGGLAASAYDQPGVCPAALRVTFRGGAQGGAVVSATELDYGHTGFGHNNDFTEGSALRLDLDCGAPTDNSCAACTVTVGCEDDNCRCENDNSIVCDEPFGPDADDCGGNTCEMFLAPPLPMALGSLPLCLVNNVEAVSTGSSNLSTGDITLEINLRTWMHFGAAQDQQCPYCEGGTCNGGERDGLACNVDASSDFGDVSYDCPPDDSNSFPPLGLPQRVTLGTSPASLPLALPCDPPLDAFDCACSACTGDLTLACNSDVECADLGAGTCMTSGAHGGASRAPNGCYDALCQPVGAEEGRCTTGGPDWTYCDGYVKGNGEGIIGCIDDTDCAPGLVGFDAGACTLVEARPCFLESINVTGTPGIGDPTLAGAFCMPPLGGFLVGGLGFPGPARMTLATHVTGVCSDGVTPWGVGGANCP